MVKVQFTKSWHAYNLGEIACYPTHVADAMVKTGVCRLVDQPAPVIQQKKAEALKPVEPTTVKK